MGRADVVVVGETVCPHVPLEGAVESAREKPKLPLAGIVPSPHLGVVMPTGCLSQLLRNCTPHPPGPVLPS